MSNAAAVSMLLVAFILVITITESASSSKKSTHYRKRGERKIWLQDSSRRLKKRGRIIFRNDEENEWWMLPQNFSPMNLDINDQTTFIENFTDYPQEMLQQILQKEGKEHMGLFGRDPLIQPFQEPKLITRMRPQETKLCPSQEEIVFPKVALNKNNEWKYVVNVGEEYVQGVRVEKCRNFDKCAMSDSFPVGYTAMCEQKYVFRRMLSVADKGKPAVDEFRLPSCCSCIVKGPSVG